MRQRAGRKGNRARQQRQAVALALLAMVLSTAGAAGQPTPTLTESRQLAERFLMADRDRDGALSRREAAQANWFSRQMHRFEELDTDGSGTVTLAEIAAAVSRQVQAWMSADTDRDGRISAAEAKAHSASLAEAFERTAPPDGLLTREQLESYSQRSYYEHAELPSVVPNIFEKRF